MAKIADLKESNFDFVYDSQSVFRVLMNSLSFPGKINKLPEIGLKNHKDHKKYLFQCALTLLDIETFFYSADKDENTSKYIEINTMSVLSEAEFADYIFVFDPLLFPDFKKIKQGALSEPDKSATLFYLIKSLSSGKEKNITLRLKGPGILESSDISFSGIDISLVSEWLSAGKDYPMGVDIFLIDESGNITGIPRSVKIEII